MLFFGWFYWLGIIIQILSWLDLLEDSSELGLGRCYGAVRSMLREQRPLWIVNRKVAIEIRSFIYIQFFFGLSLSLSLSCSLLLPIESPPINRNVSFPIHLLSYLKNQHTPAISLISVGRLNHHESWGFLFEMSDFTQSNWQVWLLKWNRLLLGFVRAASTMLWLKRWISANSSNWNSTLN